MQDSILTSKNLLKRINQRLIAETSLMLKAKENGTKVVGYFCPYIPEEIILAADMLPIRLAFGGDTESATSGEELIKPYNCPFVRSCLGYQVMGNNSYYQLLDAVCIAETCENVKLAREYWESLFGIKVINMGLPHTHDSYRSRSHAFEYFKNELELLLKRLSNLSGRTINNGDLRRSIKLCNQIRKKIRLLFAYQQMPNPPIEWIDCFHVIQAGFLIQRHDFLTELTIIEHELTQKKLKVVDDHKPRLMVTGSIIGIGDDKILDIIDQVGGRIVADNICTGLLNSRKDVIISGVMGNPIDALTERYLYNVPCPCMTDLDRRLSRIAQIIHTYHVSGVIYHCLKFCDSWRFDYPLIKDYLDKELKIPSLIVESDYSSADTGTVRTKIEAFIEIIGD